MNKSDEFLDITKYKRQYSESNLLTKIKKVASKAGIKVIYSVLLLYYTLTSDHVSKKDKSLIIAALGYFILPVDLIPDLTPLIGFSDDLTAMVYVLRTIWINITPDIKTQARNRLSEWFEKYSEEDLLLF